MLATASHYGFNTGQPRDEDTIVDLVVSYVSNGIVAVRFDPHNLALRLSNETVDSPFPIAVDVAWAISSQLSNAECIAINNAMGSRGVNMAATFFSDEFPARRKTPVLGKRVWNWRIPAAYSAVLLMSQAETAGLVTL